MNAAMVVLCLAVMIVGLKQNDTYLALGGAVGMLIFAGHWVHKSRKKEGAIPEYLLSGLRGY